MSRLRRRFDRRNCPPLRPSPHPPSRRPHLGSPPLNPLVPIAPSPPIGSQDGGDVAAAIILDQEVCGSLVGFSPCGVRGVGIVGTRGLHFPQVVPPPHHQTFFCHSNSFPYIRELSVIQVYTAVMRVGAYIDGLNLHYGGRHLCGHDTPGWRWLDIAKLVERLLGRNRAWTAQEARVHRIVFCWWYSLTDEDFRSCQLPETVGEHRRPAGW